MSKLNTSQVKTPEIIKKVDKQEKEAVDNFNKIAKEAMAIIKENHFHLRLWKAVGGNK